MNPFKLVQVQVLDKEPSFQDEEEMNKNCAKTFRSIIVKTFKSITVEKRMRLLKPTSDNHKCKKDIIENQSIQTRRTLVLY